MICKLCDVETTGSVGPASGILRPICSECAAQEDGAALAHAVAFVDAMDTFYETLNPTPLTTEVLQ